MNRVEKAKKLRPIIESAMQSVDDKDALEATLLFPTWDKNATYNTGTRVVYGGVLYKVLTDHNAQESWTPEASPSLFAKVLIPNEEIIPEWEQPDSSNAYMTGDKIMFEGAIYESLIDNNVWSPTAYPQGWAVC